MAVLFYLVNGFMGTAGSYLLFRRFQHLGLAAAGVCLTVGSIWAMGDDQWWPMLGGMALAFVAHRVIGDPLTS